MPFLSKPSKISSQKNRPSERESKYPDEVVKVEKQDDGDNVLFTLMKTAHFLNNFFFGALAIRVLNFEKQIKIGPSFLQDYAPAVAPLTDCLSDVFRSSEVRRWTRTEFLAMTLESSKNLRLKVSQVRVEKGGYERKIIKQVLRQVVMKI